MQTAPAPRAAPRATPPRWPTRAPPRPQWRGRATAVSAGGGGGRGGSAGGGAAGGGGGRADRRAADRDDDDPRYAPVIVHDAPRLGRVAVRPLAPARAPAAAAALAAAFADDAAPPTLDWLTRELSREAARYDADPTPWTEGRVELPVRPWVMEKKEKRVPPPAPSLTIPAALKQTAAAAADDDDEARVRLEEAWGRWVWLEAAATATADCVGAAALLLHDRAAALAALADLRRARPSLPGATAAAMDYALWLRDAPPPLYAPRRAACLWWVGVPPAARRRGVGAALVAAAEGVAAGAGFHRVAVQADRADARRASASMLLAALAPPRLRPPPPGRALYEAVGYGVAPAPPLAAVEGSVDRSAVLMTKWVGPPNAGGDDPWL